MLIHNYTVVQKTGHLLYFKITSTNVDQHYRNNFWHIESKKSAQYSHM